MKLKLTVHIAPQNVQKVQKNDEKCSIWVSNFFEFLSVFHEIKTSLILSKIYETFASAIFPKSITSEISSFKNVD